MATTWSAFRSFLMLLLLFLSAIVIPFIVTPFSCDCFFCAFWLLSAVYRCVLSSNL